MKIMAVFPPLGFHPPTRYSTNKSSLIEINLGGEDPRKQFLVWILYELHKILVGHIAAGNNIHLTNQAYTLVPWTWHQLNQANTRYMQYRLVPIWRDISYLVNQIRICDAPPFLSVCLSYLFTSVATLIIRLSQKVKTDEGVSAHAMLNHHGLVF